MRHGAQGNYAAGVNQSVGLWGISRGFTVLSLNGRDWGTAAGGGDTLFEDTTLDMGVGINFLERIGFPQVVVAGHSGGTQAAGVYSSLSNGDPRAVAVVLLGVVRDGREAATQVLFLPRDKLYDQHVAVSKQLVAEGQGQVVRDYMTTFLINLRRSARSFLSYYGPDTLSVVIREITKTRVPVLLLRAKGDGFTPDAYSVDVEKAALAAGVDATYTELPYLGPEGPTGSNAHAFLGVENRMMQQATDWLEAKVSSAVTRISIPLSRDGDNYLPLADAGSSFRVESPGGETRSLDGGASLDLDGTLIRTAWRQTRGPQVNFLGVDTLKPIFVVPKSSTTLEFALTITDNQGGVATDIVTVEVASLRPPGGSGSVDWLVLGGLAIFGLGRGLSGLGLRR